MFPLPIPESKPPSSGAWTLPYLISGLLLLSHHPNSFSWSPLGHLFNIYIRAPLLKPSNGFPLPLPASPEPSPLPHPYLTPHYAWITQVSLLFLENSKPFFPEHFPCLIPSHQKSLSSNITSSRRPPLITFVRQPYQCPTPQVIPFHGLVFPSYTHYSENMLSIYTHGICFPHWTMSSVKTGTLSIH